MTNNHFLYFNKNNFKRHQVLWQFPETPPITPPNTPRNSPTPIQFSQIRNNTRPTGVLNPGLITPQLTLLSTRPLASYFKVAKKGIFIAKMHYFASSKQKQGEVLLCTKTSLLLQYDFNRNKLLSLTKSSLTKSRFDCQPSANQNTL